MLIRHCAMNCAGLPRNWPMPAISTCCSNAPNLARCVTVSRRRARRPMTRSERSEEHTSELQSLMRNSYAVFCLKKNNNEGWRFNTTVLIVNVSRTRCSTQEGHEYKDSDRTV